VGAMMLTPVKKIEMDDYTEAIPAFLTMIMMPLSHSISEGILFGVLSYVLLKIFSGKYRELSVTTILLAVLFMLKFFL